MLMCWQIMLMAVADLVNGQRQIVNGPVRSGTTCYAQMFVLILYPMGIVFYCV